VLHSGKTYIAVQTDGHPRLPQVHLPLLHILLSQCRDRPEESESPTANECALAAHHNAPLQGQSALAHWLASNPDELNELFEAGFGLLDLVLVVAPQQLATLHKSDCKWLRSAHANRRNQLARFKKQFAPRLAVWHAQEQQTFLPEMFPNGVQLLYTEDPVWLRCISQNPCRWSEWMSKWIRDESHMKTLALPLIRTLAAEPEPDPWPDHRIPTERDATWIQWNRQVARGASASPHPSPSEWIGRAMEYSYVATVALRGHRSGPKDHRPRLKPWALSTALLHTASWRVCTVLPLAMDKSDTHASQSGIPHGPTPWAWNSFWVRTLAENLASTHAMPWFDEDARVALALTAPYCILPPPEERAARHHYERTCASLEAHSPPFRHPQALRWILYGNDQYRNDQSIYQTDFMTQMQSYERTSILLRCPRNHVAMWNLAPTLHPVASLSSAGETLECPRCARPFGTLVWKTAIPFGNGCLWVGQTKLEAKEKDIVTMPTKERDETFLDTDCKEEKDHPPASVPARDGTQSTFHPARDSVPHVFPEPPMMDDMYCTIRMYLDHYRAHEQPWRPIALGPFGMDGLVTILAPSAVPSAETCTLVDAPQLTWSQVWRLLVPRADGDERLEWVPTETIAKWQGIQDETTARFACVARIGMEHGRQASFLTHGTALDEKRLDSAVWSFPSEPKDVQDAREPFNVLAWWYPWAKASVLVSQWLYTLTKISTAEDAGQPMTYTQALKWVAMEWMAFLLALWPMAHRTWVREAEMLFSAGSECKTGFALAEPMALSSFALVNLQWSPGTPERILGRERCLWWYHTCLHLLEPHDIALHVAPLRLSSSDPTGPVDPTDSNRPVLLPQPLAPPATLNGHAPSLMDATGQDHPSMDATGHNHPSMDATGHNHLSMDATDPAPRLMDATGHNHLSMDASGAAPRVMDATRHNHLSIGAAGPVHLPMTTTGHEPLSMNRTADSSSPAPSPTAWVRAYAHPSGEPFQLVSWPLLAWERRALTQAEYMSLDLSTIGLASPSHPTGSHVLWSPKSFPLAMEQLKALAAMAFVDASPKDQVCAWTCWIQLLQWPALQRVRTNNASWLDVRSREALLLWPVDSSMAQGHLQVLAWLVAHGIVGLWWVRHEALTVASLTKGYPLRREHGAAGNVSVHALLHLHLPTRVVEEWIWALCTVRDSIAVPVPIVFDAWEGIHDNPHASCFPWVTLIKRAFDRGEEGRCHLYMALVALLRAAQDVAHGKALFVEPPEGLHVPPVEWDALCTQWFISRDMAHPIGNVQHDAVELNPTPHGSVESHGFPCESMELNPHDSKEPSTILHESVKLNPHESIEPHKVHYTSAEPNPSGGAWNTSPARYRVRMHRPQAWWHDMVLTLHQHLYMLNSPGYNNAHHQWSSEPHEVGLVLEQTMTKGETHLLTYRLDAWRPPRYKRCGIQLREGDWPRGGWLASALVHEAQEKQTAGRKKPQGKPLGPHGPADWDVPLSHESLSFSGTKGFPPSGTKGFPLPSSEAYCSPLQRHEARIAERLKAIPFPRYVHASNVEKLIRAEAEGLPPSTLFTLPQPLSVWTALVWSTLIVPVDAGTLVVVCEPDAHAWNTWFLSASRRLETTRAHTCVWLDHYLTSAATAKEPAIAPLRRGAAAKESAKPKGTAKVPLPIFTVHSSFRPERGEDFGWHSEKVGDALPKCLELRGARPHMVVVRLDTLITLWRMDKDHSVFGPLQRRFWFRTWKRVVVTHPVALYMEAFRHLHAGFTWVVSSAPPRSCLPLVLDPVDKDDTKAGRAKSGTQTSLGQDDTKAGRGKSGTQTSLGQDDTKAGRGKSGTQTSLDQDDTKVGHGKSETKASLDDIQPTLGKGDTRTSLGKDESKTKARHPRMPLHVDTCVASSTAHVVRLMEMPRDTFLLCPTCIASAIVACDWKSQEERFLAAHVLVLRWQALAHWIPPVGDTSAVVVYWKSLERWRRHVVRDLGFEAVEVCEWWFTTLRIHNSPHQPAPEVLNKQWKAMCMQFPPMRLNRWPLSCAEQRRHLRTYETLANKTIADRPFDWNYDYREHTAWGSTRGRLEPVAERVSDVQSSMPWMPKTSGLARALWSWTLDKRWMLLSPTAYTQWLHRTYMFKVALNQCQKMASTMAKHGLSRTLPTCLATHESRSIVSQLVTLIQSGALQLRTFTVFAEPVETKRKTKQSGRGTSSSMEMEMTNMVHEAGRSLQDAMRDMNVASTALPGRETQVVLYTPTSHDVHQSEQRKMQAQLAKMAPRPTQGKKRKRGAPDPALAAPLASSTAVPLTVQQLNTKIKTNEGLRRSFQEIQCERWEWSLDMDAIGPQAWRMVCPALRGSNIKDCFDVRNQGIWVLVDGYVSSSHNTYQTWKERTHVWQTTGPCTVHTTVAPRPFCVWTHEHDTNPRAKHIPCTSVLHMILLTSQPEKWTDVVLLRHVAFHTEWSCLPNVYVRTYKC
jgi:hypothetical protein